MNPLLQVKLQYQRDGNPSRGGGLTLAKDKQVSAEKIDRLTADLRAVLRFYHREQAPIKGILIDICYDDIIAKSKRVKELLKPKNGSVNDSVVGARFSNAAPGDENHIITLYAEKETVEETLRNLDIVRRFITDRLDGTAVKAHFENKKLFEKAEIPKSRLQQLIVDCSVVNAFAVPDTMSDIEHPKSNIVTFFKTELPTYELLEKLNLDRYGPPIREIDDNTISINENQLTVLREKVPYLISMISSDISKLSPEDVLPPTSPRRRFIPEPAGEPVIGVIDTLFDENVYFGSWVEYKDCRNQYEKLITREGGKNHGTQVSSVIVDGPGLNPGLDDGCGRFRVRHFGVCDGRISISRLTNLIKDIIRQNPDIHVWNLSLGDEDEISKNFISYEAAVLDELQAQNNIVFVVSGTNDNRNEKTDTLKVGSPADSLNAVVVNSVRRDGTPASYTRKGNILSFFNKPDVAYYGGDDDERITACSPHGEEAVYGTSFAAPWISRKLCYLIDIMGLPREVAKALLIDSAAGWQYKNRKPQETERIGYGVVPINISDIITANSDEIKFTLFGTSKTYKTTNYKIPVPTDENGDYPFIARATLCYFPKCTRAQGIDYTNRELSLQFGRINDKDLLKDINENTQDTEGCYNTERKSRKKFRKWENTKFISQIPKKNQRPLKRYEDRSWAVAVTSKERLSTRTEDNLNFGIIITLKEIKGVNRIQAFVKSCEIRGIFVNELQPQIRHDIYAKAQQDITFDEQ